MQQSNVCKFNQDKYVKVFMGPDVSKMKAQYSFSFVIETAVVIGIPVVKSDCFPVLQS